MKKLLVSSLVILGSAVSLNALAGEKIVVVKHYNNPGKVIVKRGCDNTSCHYTKKRVHYNNNGKKIVDTRKCKNDRCINISKKVSHKHGAKITKKTVCNAHGHHCIVTKTKKF